MAELRLPAGTGQCRLLAEHEDFFVREAAAEALGRIQTSKATDLLNKLASDVHPQVVSAARRSVSLREQRAARSAGFSG